ncbi:MAG: hypothetical protein HYZ53_15370 [Planctomycetes bacterium]|nr:hypothetical protein [Planctomycetota bacterium]
MTQLPPNRRSGAHGTAMTENVLVVSLVAIGVLACVALFGRQLSNLFIRSTTSLNSGQVVAATTTSPGAYSELSGGSAAGSSAGSSGGGGEGSPFSVEPAGPSRPRAGGGGGGGGGSGPGAQPRASGPGVRGPGSGGGTGTGTPGTGTPGGGGGGGGEGAEPIRGGNGPRDADRGHHYVRGPHYEYEVSDSDHDGTRDTAQIRGSLARGHSEANAGGIIGYQADGELVYGEGQAYARGNNGAGAGASAGAGVARGNVAVNLGDQVNPLARAEGSGSVLSADAGADAFIGDDGRRIGIGARANAQARVAEGRVGSEYNIPIPFTNQSIRLRSGVSGSVLSSPGGAAGAAAYYDREEGRFHLGGLLDIEAILGVGIDADFSFGRRPTTRGE